MHYLCSRTCQKNVWAIVIHCIALHSSLPSDRISQRTYLSTNWSPIVFLWLVQWVWVNNKNVGQINKTDGRKQGTKFGLTQSQMPLRFARPVAVKYLLWHHSPSPSSATNAVPIGDFLGPWPSSSSSSPRCWQSLHFWKKTMVFESSTHINRYFCLNRSYQLTADDSTPTHIPSKSSARHIRISNFWFFPTAILFSPEKSTI